MNHIAFRRVGDVRSDNRFNRKNDGVHYGKVYELELPEHLEDISSTKSGKISI